MIQHYMFDDHVQRQIYDFCFTEGKLAKLSIRISGRGVTIVETYYRTPDYDQYEIDNATFMNAVKSAIYDKDGTAYFENFLKELSKDDKYFPIALAVISEELDFLSSQTHSLAKTINTYISSN